MTPKYKIVKFNRKDDFNLWLVKMHALLVHQRLLKALQGREALQATLLNDKQQDLLEQAHSVIHFLLLDEVLCDVANETIAFKLWPKLKSLYMTKSPTNRLYLK